MRSADYRAKVRENSGGGDYFSEPENTYFIVMRLFFSTHCAFCFLMTEMAVLASFCGPSRRASPLILIPSIPCAAFRRQQKGGWEKIPPPPWLIVYTVRLVQGSDDQIDLSISECLEAGRLHLCLVVNGPPDPRVGDSLLLRAGDLGAVSALGSAVAA